MPTLSAIIWKLAGIALLVVALGVQTMRITSLQHDMRNEVFKHQADIDLWRSAGVIAVERAKAAKAATEAARMHISDEVDHDTQKHLDALNAALDRLRFTPSTDPSGTGATSVSSTTAAAVDSALSTDTAVLSRDDARRCGEAYIIASGWQIFWHKLTEAAK